MKIIDTDILSYYLRKPEDHYRVFLKIEALSKEELFTTVINYSEILYGCLSSRSLLGAFTETAKYFLGHFNILVFDKRAARIFAENKARLKLKGIILPDADLMIASIAMAHNATLITHNTKHFSRIKGLKLEDWMIV